MSELMNIPVGKIREGNNNLRGVDTESEAFLRFVDNISKHGVINPISVKEYVEYNDENTDEIVFEGYRIVDGLQRLYAARLAGLETIPAQVLAVDDDDKLDMLQISANLQRHDTKPAEYARKVREMMYRRPLATLAEFANELNTTEAFLKGRLVLNKLTPEIQEKVDAGDIKLQQANRLAQLPASEQAEWVEQAMNDDPATFAASVDVRLKQIRQESSGKRGEAVEFQPKARLRKISEVQDEISKPRATKGIISSKGVSDPVEIIRETLRWVLNMDDETIAAAKAKFDAEEKEKAEKRERRKLSTIEKKKEEFEKKLKQLEAEEAEEKARLER